MRGLIKRTPECALHVHVGLPDTDAAVRGDERHPRAAAAAPRARRELAVLVRRRLGHGQLARGGDPRLSGPRRSRRCCAAGTSTWPPRRRARPAAARRDHTMVWWDARPQPRLGTVELREMDVQTDLESAGGDRRAGARDHERGRWRSRVTDPAPEQALHWSSFRAARDGLDAEIYFDGSPRPLREVAEAVLDEDRRRADPELEGIRRIVREGGGADRQRAAFADGGMPGLLRYLADGNR